MPSGICLRVMFAMLLGEVRLHHAAGALFDQRLQIDAVDHIDGVQHVALGLGHLLAVAVAHQAVDVDLPEGTSPMNLRPIMIMRATQKKMMSNPVTRTLVG